MGYRLLSAILVLFTISNKLAAQNDNNQIEFSGIHALSVFTPEKYNLTGQVWGGELAYHLNMSQNKADYIRVLNISAIDIVGSYRSFRDVLINNVPASKGQLGDAYTALGRLEINLAGTGPVRLLFTPGLGFTYSTETYFTDKVPLVGSHINLTAQAGLKLFAGITPSTGIIGGLDILHYSNVGVRVPNFGINSYNLSLGLVQRVPGKGPATSDHPFAQPHGGSVELGGDFGMRGQPYSKNEFYRAGFYAGYNYQLTSVFSLKGGFDAGYYFTPFKLSDYDRTFAEYGSSYERWRVGISVGGDMALGRLVVMAAYGYYLYYHSYFNNKTYWTPGLKYYVTPWMALQGKAYIHYADADYLGWGLLFRVH